MAPATNVMDLRARAKRRIPRSIFEYADRGSYDELTIAENSRDLDAIRLRQRVMVDVSAQQTATTILGVPAAMPLAIAPTGLTGLFHPNGEAHGARAAAKAGIPFCLSTMSILSIEDVAEMSGAPFWFQLYVMRDRDFSASLIERAKAAGCPALVLTLDLQVQGQRHRDLKNGLSVPPKLTLANAIDIATKPGWAFGMLGARRQSFGNLEEQLKKAGGLSTLSQWIAGQFDPSLNWSDVAWVRSLWPGKLILKGVMDADDARRAVDSGADAVVVSNHGGRQLDGAISSITALPEVVAAVGDRTEVLFDGGVRSGQDVFKALAHGAKACLIGKAFLWSLAAGGEDGVSQALGFIRKELAVTMALTGVADLRDIGPHVLRARRET
jgi:L-lactate dehydrogenase (cytochrome)